MDIFPYQVHIRLTQAPVDWCILQKTMQYVDLGVSGLQSSALGFGCSAMMGRVGRKPSLRALHAAYDAGITFFDTARCYGYGESEAILGAFLEGRRGRVILSTKFGIVPVPQGRWKRALKPMVRAALATVPTARRLIRNQVKAQFQENRFSRDVLRRSLEESLRKLRTEYVDLLFLHSPPASVLSQDDLLENLERLIESGKVRMAGISADPEVIIAALGARLPALTAMQFPVNLFDLSLMRHITSAQRRELMFVANHPFGGKDRVASSRRRLMELVASPKTSPQLRHKLTTGDDDLLPEIILNLVLTGTGIQVVVASMMNLSHLRANVEAVSHCRFTGHELAWIRSNLSEDLAEADVTVGKTPA